MEKSCGYGLTLFSLMYSASSPPVLPNRTSFFTPWESLTALETSGQELEYSPGTA